MLDAIRYERVRLRTLRSTFLLYTVGVLLAGLVAFAYGASDDDPLSAEGASILLTGGGDGVPFPLLALFVGYVGVLAAGHEYRHGTILPTLTAIPRRSRLIAAKVLVIACASLAVTALSIVLNAVIGLLTRGEVVPLGGVTTAVLVGYLILLTLWGVLGVALAQLTRSIAVGVLLLFALPAVVEPLMYVLAAWEPLNWLTDLLPYLPFRASLALLGTEGATNVNVGGQIFGELSRWQGGAVFAAFVAAVLVPAAVLLNRRDA